MTTRRSFLTLVGAGVAAGVVGCRESTNQSTVGLDGAPDVVVVGSGADLVVVRELQLDRHPLAVLSPAGDRIYTSQFVRADTDVIVASIDGATTSVTRLAGHWQPRIASAYPSLVAFTPPSFGLASGAPIAGVRTPIVVFDGTAEVAIVAEIGRAHV